MRGSFTGAVALRVHVFDDQLPVLARLLLTELGPVLGGEADQRFPIAQRHHAIPTPGHRLDHLLG